jgi:hypothetical protein
MPDPFRTELIFSFLALRLSAKGLVAILLSFPLSLVLIALAWRILHG